MPTAGPGPPPPVSGWLTLAAVLTFGIAAPLLGIYLSLWIRRKGRSILASGLLLPALRLVRRPPLP